jgi:hypothetical protein
LPNNAKAPSTSSAAALKQRALAPHIYEHAEEATTHLRDLEKRKTG